MIVDSVRGGGKLTHIFCCQDLEVNSLNFVCLVAVRQPTTDGQLHLMGAKRDVYYQELTRNYHLYHRSIPPRRRTGLTVENLLAGDGRVGLHPFPVSRVKD